MHDDTRMAVEPELCLKRVDRLGALLGRQSVRRLGADRGVIERLLALRADGVGVHLDERAAQVLRDGASGLDEAHALVLLGVAEVRCELLRPGAGFALDDHASRPSALRIASRTTPRPASACLQLGIRRRRAAEIHVAGDLVEVAADMAKFAEQPRQLPPLDRRSPHLARRGRTKQHLTGIAAG